MTQVPTRRWARLLDLAVASPQLALYGAAITGTVVRAGGQLDALQRAVGLTPGLELLSQLTNALFLTLLIVLLIVRRLPVNGSRGILPKLWALIGFSCLGVLVILPPAEIDLMVRILSLILTLMATIASIYIASYLGKSYSVFPQARGLVLNGPYRIVRHPLYLAESIAALGISLQFLQPWSLMVAIGAILAQIPRMHYEEQVLLAAYPEYGRYLQKTSRLIPGIY